MLRDNLPPFGNITALANLQTILAHGICSQMETTRRGLSPVSIANDDVQDRRANKRLHGVPLHDYACLYFDPRNPMLLAVLGNLDDIAVLLLDTDVLDLPGARVTDMNAARGDARDYPVPEGLHYLDEELIYREEWSHSSEQERYKRKGHKCAEVLVPGHVPPHFIREVVVGSQVALQTAQKLRPRVPVRLDQYLFFDAGRSNRG